MKDIEQVKDEIEEQDRIINELDDKLQERMAVVEDLERRLHKQDPDYRAIQGDLVDEMLAQYINLANCPVPIRRLGGGYYMFGTRKIYAKIMNGKLVIRVGGGYMIIEEFIAAYAEQEVARMNKIAEKEALKEEQASFDAASSKIKH